MNPETVTLPTAIVTLVNAALALLLAFGVNVTETQTAAIVTFVNAVLLIAGVLWDYRKRKVAAAPVTPTPPAVP